MSSKVIILLLFLIGLGFYSTNAQTINCKERLHLFTDRAYCISGDTLWFKVCLPDTLEQRENIVRVQLDKGNNLISSVAKKSENGWAEGFIHVPDSLSSGLCFVTAFLNSQRNNSELEVESNSLFVYNRFEERVTKLEVPQFATTKKSINFISPIKLNSDKTKYSTREKVMVNIESDSTTEIANAVVRATLLDPLASEFGGEYIFESKSSNSVIPDFIEKNGFLFSGKVVDSEGNAQKGVLIVLSIVGEPPYFDYYVSGNEGDFHFFLKNAVGNTDVVLQAISKSGREYFIQQEVSSLVRKKEIPLQTKILTPLQSNVISAHINGNFIRKLFNPSSTKQNRFFKMPPRFNMPFYGPPTLRVVPNDFFDLPDFQEISRELLQGVQYRNKNGQITFRMLNQKQGVFFENEPLRLLNGVPIFKNSLLVSLKSSDISYIDIVQKERVFGDLTFKGILAVSLNDKSNNWLARQPNIFQFKINCLQAEKKPGYLSPLKTRMNQPDVRQIYLWEILQPGSVEGYNFFLSDLKGEIEISIEGVTKSNEVFKASKIIEVK